jgi:hypothetical protein
MVVKRMLARRNTEVAVLLILWRDRGLDTMS